MAVLYKSIERSEDQPASRTDFAIRVRVEWLQEHFAKGLRQNGLRIARLRRKSGHLHAIIEYQPKVSISVLVNALKGTSSRMLRKERPDHL